MNVSWGKIENEKNKGILQVEVDVEKVKEALDLAFKKVVKTINVPGFRKGKVPRQVFESRFGVEVLYMLYWYLYLLIFLKHYTFKLPIFKEFYRNV